MQHIKKLKQQTTKLLQSIHEQLKPHHSLPYLKYKMVPIEMLIGKRGKNQMSMRDVPIEKAAEFGIADKVLFTGFLRGQDIDKAYQMADLYVMPSVSEPFGITPLEAMRNNTPVIISKQSGVSEVVNNCLANNGIHADNFRPNFFRTQPPPYS